MSMRRGAHTIILALAAAGASCGGSEKTVVDQYFPAILAEDTQTLSSFAAARFEQKPEAWKILAVQPETRQPAPLPALATRVTEAEQALKENKKAYASSNSCVQCESGLKAWPGTPLRAA